MKKVFTFKQIVESLREAIQTFPDKRTGKNLTYFMIDAALGAFSVFFTQCPSFLARQKEMEETEGRSNAQTLFQMEQIPTDNHIRNLLDPVSPKLLSPVFDKALAILNDSGYLSEFRIFNGDLLVPLDGTWYFSSKKIHCDNCSTIEHKDGTITYYHCVLTPVIAAPGQNKVIPLIPEFIVPQDGHDKQDCENAAALLTTFIILAFLFHTLLDFMDKRYRLIRKRLPSRETFFNHIRTLTYYMCFDNWDHLMDFMIKGLKIKLESG